MRLVRFSDWSAIIAPMLVFTELRDMVSYPSCPESYACPAFCGLDAILSLELTADEARPRFHHPKPAGISPATGRSVAAMSWYEACIWVCTSESCDSVAAISTSSAEETCVGQRGLRVGELRLRGGERRLHVAQHAGVLSPWR